MVWADDLLKIDDSEVEVLIAKHHGIVGAEAPTDSLDYVGDGEDDGDIRLIGAEDSLDVAGFTIDYEVDVECLLYAVLHLALWSD
jgi:hypothetical protein